MLRRFAVVVSLGIGATFPMSVPTGPVEDFIRSEMRVSGVPGLSYAVVADGQTISTGTHGVVKAGGDEQITSTTAFLTGSISKSFTALAVMQLVEAGEIELDAEISRYLHTFSGQPAGAILIRQLLSHTSGFSTVQGNASPADTDGGKDVLARRVDQLARSAPAHPPGARWEYSNTNYQILGRLVEVVSGRTYQDIVTSRILQPIGMTDSFVADGDSHEAMATGHRSWFGTKAPLPGKRTDRGTAPQGGIIASARDLARYMQVMMNGKNDVLSADGKALMMRPAGEASPFY